MQAQHQQKNLIPLSTLLPLLINLAQQACKITRDLYEKVAIIQKSPNDPVTEADFKIQSLIVKYLRKQFPELKIVGEEEVQFKGEIKDLDERQKIQLFDEKIKQKFYEVKDLCVWIDPIDNTRGFVEGRGQEVTNLIGVSYKGNAQIGVIGLPFRKKIISEQKSEAEYHPEIFVGCKSLKIAYSYQILTKKWTPLSPPLPSKQTAITLSPTRLNKIQKIIAQQLNAKILHAGGSGYKTLLIIKSFANIFAYCDSYTKKWDTCAGQAIMQAMGGTFFDEFGIEILYDWTQKSYVNDRGIVCGFQKQLCKKVVQICVRVLQEIKKEKSKQGKL